MRRPRPLSETFERYALGLVRPPGLPAARAGAGTAAATAKLKSLGCRGWPSRRTFHTRELPMGCRPCLEGRGSSISLTTLCNRDCFFCFNPKPRADAMSVHGRAVRSPAEAGDILASLGTASVGVSGGEPLLFPERTLSLVRGLRRRLAGVWIDLYTNGDLLTPDLLRELKDAGVDSLRLNLAANGYDPRPVEAALPVFPDLAVEIPVVPADEAKVRRLMGRLERLEVRHLILHELFRSGINEPRLAEAGCRTRAGRGQPKALTWSGVARSEECALRLVAGALERGLRLGVYYCSTGTQQWIAEKALKRGRGG